jgi:hypothetical protein
MYCGLFVVGVYAFAHLYSSMFEDDVSDSASTCSGSPDEDLLGSYMYVFEYP